MNEVQHLNYQLIPLSCPKGGVLHRLPKSLDSFQSKAGISRGNCQRALLQNIPVEGLPQLFPSRFREAVSRLVSIATKCRESARWILASAGTGSF